MSKKSKKILFKILKILGKILGVLLLLFILLVLFVRSPWGQGIIVDKAVSYVKDKTNTEVRIDKLFVTFDGNISLDGLYLEDTQGDTLVFSKHLEAEIPLWSVITGGPISVDDVTWEGVRANVVRKDSITGYNYQFLIDAFAATDTTSVQPAPTAQDTTALQLNLGTFDFKDIQLNYTDQVTGMQANLNLGALEVQMQETNLEEMLFDIGDVRLANTKVVYKQKEPITPSADTTEVPLPILRIGELIVEDVTFDYASTPDGIAADGTLAVLETHIPQIDLKNNVIEVEDFLLKNSVVNLALQTVEKQEAATEALPKTSQELWPPFTVAVGEINLENNAIQYTLDGAQPSAGRFNPNAIALSDLNLNLEGINLKDQNLEAHVIRADFKEVSGMNLDELAFDLQVSDTRLDLDNIAFQLNQNALAGTLQLDYSSLNAFIEEPGSAALKLNIPQLTLNLNTLFKFSPELRANEYLATLSKRPLRGSLNLSGKLDAIDLKPTRINWGNQTSLAVQGSIYNASTPENLSYNLPVYTVKSAKRDLGRFVDEQALGVQFPEKVTLQGSLKGTTTRAATKSILTTTDGIVRLVGNASFGDTLEFKGDVSAQQINLGKLLQNEQLGFVELQLQAEGAGNSINTLDATVNATIDSIQLNNYTFKDLGINGAFKSGTGDLKTAYKDENLNMTLDARVILDSVASQAAINLDLIGADLQALGLTEQNIKAALTLQGTFKGDPEDYEIQTQINEGVAVYDDRAYQLGDLDISAYVKPDTTSLAISNRILNLDLESNANPQQVITSVQNHFKRYLQKNPVLDSIQDPVLMKITGTVHQAPILGEVFIPNLRELDTVDISVDFDEYKRTLNADIQLPYINYNGYTIDSLALKIVSNKENMDFGFGLKELIAGPVDMQDTRIGGRVTNSKMYIDFLSMHDKEKLVHVLYKIALEEDNIKIQIDPDDFILNKKPWEINPNNSVTLTKTNTIFEDFEMSYNNQRITAGNNLQGISKEHLGINFENFKLANIMSLLNPDAALARGKLSGQFAVEDPYTSPGMVLDLNIRDFEVLETNMGVLTAQGNSISNSGYDFQMAIKEGVADLDLKGNYTANETAAQIDLNLDLNRFDVAALEKLSFGELSNADGTISGAMKLAGTTAEPRYEGAFQFDNAKFEVTKLNASFLLKNENLNLNNEGVTFNNFRVEDENANPIVVNGSIGTESFVNPTFDLDLKATNFKAINSTKDDFDLVYGTAVFDADAQITGDLNLPKVTLDLTVNSDTDVTYVLPPSEVQIESKEGVVLFVNKENPDAILTNNEEDSYTVSGFTIDANFGIEKGAVFNLVIDEQTGDNFQVSGTGDFEFDMYPNGRMTLSGRYDVTDGHYEMSLYNLVNRRFELAPDSRITWSGDPFDADLDIKAYYSVETSASGLMASQTSGADISTQMQYRQEVPFQVYININGELMQPIISFNLDIPEGSRGAVGGQVYSRVQQLNQQENELNKQVFSLLVLNRFFPTSSSDGSSGGTAAIARDNLNDAISDQLNMFSDKLLGDTGFNLNFGLDSYTDYQGSAPTDRTTLDIAAQKSLFNDRVVVSVGSAVDLQGSGNTDSGNAPVVGNVSIEYLLTEDGRYRLRGYRSSQFENIIDGQIIVNGISLQFTREFNKFTELWQSMFPAKTEEEEDTNE